MRTSVNAKDGGIQIEKIRRAKDRKVIVGFRTTEERTRVKERIEKAGTNLIVEEIKNKDPLLVLKNVIAIHSDADLEELIRSQNKDLFKDLDKNIDRMEFRFRKRARNPLQKHVVVRVSPIIWRRALDRGTVSIDIQPIRVEDQSPLVQCSKCLGYGHGRRLCIETELKCSHCGEAHMRNECPNWLAGSDPDCCNCRKAKITNSQHNAFSSDCPIKRRWDTLARSMIEYC
ncbi:hypothetical protein O0L34_g10039 [Tuta absoluta]|nr:hypothetical protein O0L34_g10039 [Tuta absoluta]